MSRRPTPLALLFVIALAGCAQDASEPDGAPAAEDFRMQEEQLRAWREPILDAEGVIVRVEPQTASVGEIVEVVVENQQGGNLTFVGSDCGLMLARPEGSEWVIFAAAPGTFDDVTHQFGSGDACQTRLDLSGLQTMRDGEPQRVTLPPSDYRVVFLATAGPDGNATALASTPLRVQG